jgi:hypothetical protein
MILFYSKQTGEIFATIDGRVHDEIALSCCVNNGIGKENIGKYIIGWIEKDGQKIEYNLDKFDLLQRFEDTTPESPLDYKIDIETNTLIKKDGNRS